MNKLLEKATRLTNAVQTTHKIYTDDEINLAVAWANGEVSKSSIQKVLSLATSGQVYIFLAIALREYIKKL